LNNYYVKGKTMAYELTRQLLAAWEAGAPEPDANHQAKAQAAESYAEFLLAHLAGGASPAAASLQSHIDNTTTED